ncbi:hypothetical protein SAY87_003908 [Trapa incisa]|uniref:Uncharacterized protein n=1 Tax=Trapa incisa TaxID=236973 RepID=A0AAN7JN04_9MYRT|nr:hypothetical protein SAY87_003908 [Trapa incisa]
MLGEISIFICYKLRAAPEKQLQYENVAYGSHLFVIQNWDAAIFHASFGRLLGEPRSSSMNLHESWAPLQFFHMLVVIILIRNLSGFEVTSLIQSLLLFIK